LQGNSSNLLLVPLGNIVFAGSGADRTLRVSPAAGQTGSATITITASDGINSVRQRFVLTVDVPPKLFISRAGNVVDLSFETVAGGTYFLEYKDSFTEATWKTLRSFIGSGEFITVADALSDEVSRLYRLRIQ